MRRFARVLTTGAVAAAVVLGLAGPAEAALTLRAKWEMNSLPTMVDAAGGDNNGATKNIALTSGFYSFNGTSSLATVPDKPNLDPGTATIRLSARVKFTVPPAVGETYDIVRKGVTTSDGGDYKMEIYRRSTGEAVAACSFKDANKIAGQSYGTVNLAGTGWQTITCTKTATSMTVTAGGQTRTSNKAIGTISNASPVYVGGKGDGTDTFNGSMDWVRIEIG